jgi:8-oxo-dGTP diphosphatase
MSSESKPPGLQSRTVAEIDWVHWSAVDLATLIFVIRGGEILLIRKKRGLGAGKINGPGGRLEPGETPEACAMRELAEELGVVAVDPIRLGDHRFQFVDGYSTYVHVYRASDLQGTPVETDEAIPMWINLDAIPFDEMWEDDRLWVPLLVAGKRFSGYWIFEGDRMLDYRLEVY